MQRVAALSAGSGGGHHNESVARIYLIAERRKPYLEYSPCIASIADIASSPSGHKICRTSLATLVMFRTPNSALHRFVCSVPHRPVFSLPLPTDLPSPSIDTNRVHATFSHTYTICTHVRRNDPIPMHLYAVSTISPNYFESNLIETITFRSISHDPAEYIYAPSLLHSLVTPMTTLR